MFVTHKTYTSNLTWETILLQMKSLTKQWGAIQLLPDNNPSSIAQSFSFSITRARYTISVKGTLMDTGNSRRLKITYKPAIHPLYVYLPVLALFIISLTTAHGFTIDNESVSPFNGILILCGVFILFSLVGALLLTWRITDAREKVEAALKLKTIG